MDKAVGKDLFTRVQSVVCVGLMLLSLQLVLLSLPTAGKANLVLKVGQSKQN